MSIKFNFLQLRRPAVWAILYFVQIIVFSLLYSFNAQSFYHSTSLVEPSFSRDQEDLVRILEREVYSRMVGPDGWEVPQVYVSIEYESQNDQKIRVWGLFGQPLAQGRISLYSRWAGIEEIYIGVRLDPNISDEGKAMVTTSIQDWRSFDLDGDDGPIKLYAGWRDAHLGRPARENGRFSRMLYLSVVTTTTLGYGDIVPTTSWMRLAIALQTILGVVLSALFINAIIQRERTK